MICLNIVTNSEEYSVEWSNGEQGDALYDLCAGEYSVLVTDGNGCTWEEVFVIEEPEPFFVLLDGEDPSCGENNGWLVATTYGGTPPFIYEWSNGATTEGIEGLGGGLYHVIVTDANGCSYEACMTLTGMEVNIETDGVSCFGECDGAIGVNITGGTEPVEISWSTGTQGEGIDGLCAGIYELTVTDGSGCEFTEVIEISEPDPIFVDLDASDCNSWNCNGSIDATVYGGSPPYSYEWSNGATTQDIDGLCPGIYHVLVTDANGCTVEVCRTVGGQGPNTGFGILENNADIYAFPNPVTDYLNFELINNVEQTVLMKLMDISGQVIEEREVGNLTSENRGRIDMQYLAPGVYLFEIQAGNKKFIHSQRKKK